MFPLYSYFLKYQGHDIHVPPQHQKFPMTFECVFCLSRLCPNTKNLQHMMLYALVWQTPGRKPDHVRLHKTRSISGRSLQCINLLLEGCYKVLYTKYTLRTFPLVSDDWICRMFVFCLKLSGAVDTSSPDRQHVSRYICSTSIQDSPICNYICELDSLVGNWWFPLRVLDLSNIVVGHRLAVMRHNYKHRMW